LRYVKCDGAEPDHGSSMATLCFLCPSTGAQVQARFTFTTCATATQSFAFGSNRSGAARLSSRETEHVQVFIRRLSLGLDQGTPTASGKHETPVGCAIFRAARFEPLDHFALGHPLGNAAPP
jgi:hypothetical protein